MLQQSFHSDTVPYSQNMQIVKKKKKKKKGKFTISSLTHHINALVERFNFLVTWKIKKCPFADILEPLLSNLLP